MGGGGGGGGRGLQGLLEIRGVFSEEQEMQKLHPCSDPNHVLSSVGSVKKAGANSYYHPPQVTSEASHQMVLGLLLFFSNLVSN